MSKAASTSSFPQTLSPHLLYLPISSENSVNAKFAE
jgi:hypothetical protein